MNTISRRHAGSTLNGPDSRVFSVSSPPHSPLRVPPRPPRSVLFAFFATFAFSSGLLAQDLTIKAPPQDQAILITGATVHPVSSEAIENGVVYFSEGKIYFVGTRAAWDAHLTNIRIKVPRELDASGKHVYPGLIGPVTQIGLTEFGAVRQSQDLREVGDITPEARAATAVNPDSTVIPVTRTTGILTVGVFLNGRVIPGRASVMRMDGWTWEEMALEPAAGLVVSWPMMRTVSAPWMQTSEEDQRGNAGRALRAIDEAFDAAINYRTAREADPSMRADLRWDAMLACLPAGGTGILPVSESARQGSDAGVDETGAPRTTHALEARATAQSDPSLSPVFIFASDLDQITSAVAWGAERGVKIVIVGGRDAGLCPDLLKKNDVPVIVVGTHVLPRRADMDYDECYTLPARLEAAGVTWCLANSDDTPHERNLPYQAGLAVAYGLSEDAAVRSLTLTAAQILGVGDRLGSIENGKLATLIITDGSPLEPRTHVERAFIDGREIDLSSKQTKLAEKYRAKYRQMGLIRE